MNMTKEKAQAIVENIAGIARCEAAIRLNIYNNEYDDGEKIVKNTKILEQRKAALVELLTKEI